MELNVFVACDSYKGSLTSVQANECIKKGVMTVFKSANVECYPIADGGEGTVDAYTYNYGHKITVDCEGKTVEIGVNEEDNTCIIEIASVNGIMEDSKKNILERNTHKTGILIKKVLELGYKNIMIGIGGSGTNDCGIGIAAALGYRFLDAQGKEVLPNINNVFKMKTIDVTNVNPKIKEANFIVLSDVKNPLLGQNGCAHMYGKQKGANAEEIEILEKLDTKFFELCKSNGFIVNDFEGAGAAGGIGFGLVTFLNAKICSGMDYMLSKIEREEEMDGFDLIITGEGKIDEQSQYGKVIDGMQKLGAKYDIPVLSIGGSVVLENTENLLYGSCIQKCCDLKEAMDHAQSNLINATIQCLNLIGCGMEIMRRY